MVLYWVVFLNTIFATFGAEKAFNKNRFKRGVFFSILAIMIISLYAGARAETVGIDVSFYVTPYINRVSWFSSAKDYFIGLPIEPLFGLITYINGAYFSTPFFSLFVIELLIVTPLYLLMYKYRKSLSMTFSMIVFLLIIYNMTLCIMRQGICTSFILLAFFSNDYSKMKKCLLYIVAVLFHYIGIVFIVILYVIKWIVEAKHNNIYKIFGVIISIFILIMLPSIISMLAGTLGGVFAKYYGAFISGYKSGNNISILEFGLRSVLILFPLFIAEKSKLNKKVSELCYYSIYSLILSLAAVFAVYLIRISYFFTYIMVLSLPASSQLLKRKDNKLIFYSLMIIICFGYWFVIYNLWNYFGVFPYELYHN